MSLISCTRAGVSTRSSSASSSDCVFWVISKLTTRQTSSPFSMVTPSKRSHAASVRLTLRKPHKWYDRTSASSLSMASVSAWYVAWVSVSEVIGSASSSAQRKRFFMFALRECK